MSAYEDLGIQSFECTDALDDEGYVLTLANTGKVAKTADGGRVFGVAYKSTKHPITGTAEANKPVGVVQAPRYAYVQYVNAAGETIAIADLVGMKGASACTAGKVKKMAQTAWPGTYAAATSETIIDEFACIVGIALEAKAESTSGKLRVKLLCPMIWKQ